MVRVLLGEDDRFLRKAAEASLRKHGHTVLPAVDGDEVLRMARSEVRVAEKELKRLLVSRLALLDEGDTTIEEAFRVAL